MAQNETAQIQKRHPFPLDKTLTRVSAGLHFSGLLALLAEALFYAFGGSDKVDSRVLWVAVGVLALGSFLSLFLAGKQRGFWRLRRQVAYDKLTAVMDRGSFSDALHTEARRAGRYHFPLTICLLDVDDFQELNKKNGKYYADEILQKLAQITLGHIRTSDVLGRASRDEFFVLLAHTDLNQAERFLYRLYLQMQERLDISFSVGVTSYRPGESAHEMMRRCEQALERAKEEGQRKTRCLICKDDSRVVMNFDFGKISG